MICEGTSLGCVNQQHYAVNLWKESLDPNGEISQLLTNQASNSEREK